MKNLRHFKIKELESLNLIQGGKRVKSYDISGEVKTDVRKVDRDGKVIWIKHFS